MRNNDVVFTVKRSSGPAVCSDSRRVVDIHKMQQSALALVVLTSGKDRMTVWENKTLWRSVHRTISVLHRST